MGNTVTRFAVIYRGSLQRELYPVGDTWECQMFHTREEAESFREGMNDPSMMAIITEVSVPAMEYAD